MSENISEALLWPTITAQPGDVREVPDSERDKLIVSAIKVDGHWVIRSRYGDDIWQLDGLPNNVSRSNREIDFGSLPLTFRVVMKAIVYRYIRRGRRESALPKGAMIRGLVVNARPFLRHLETLRIDHLGAVTPMIAATYVSACRNHKQSQKPGKPLSQSTLQRRYSTVEALYELSQYTGDPIAQHPWPETSARAMAGMLGNVDGGKTPLIPDLVFCTLFEKAYRELERGKRLLDLRDELETIVAQSKGQKTFDTIRSKNQHLSRVGWEGGLGALKKALTTLRTACYVILASTSGCRNHELANLQSGAHHRTEDDEGTIYHWMRSTSEKTDEGLHDWMIPEAAVRALRIMERWSLPYQAMITKEIAQRRRVNSQDPQIAEAYKHRHSLFLGAESKKSGTVRTLSNTSWGGILKAFAKDCGLDWKLASHQFRRKFANYAAHSRFGDLRYLKEHYAHWSLDMTLGYAMDDSWGQHLDLDLYAEIQDELEDIKLGVVDSWMGNEPLSGGYGRAIKGWRREPENLLIFKDRASMLKSISESTAIRSNGHAWCTADNDGCVGNSLERTRCGGCDHSVIGSAHGPIYQRLYDDLKGLLHCKDIGEGGRKRVERDLNRYRDVLVQLGMPPETLTA
ncbi:integrase [Pseudomonas viridiflava]|uniref:integrase n=1 Tax=Pseudomonas viridiflava TaxID=33069 RepID=UPI00211DA2D9|nr:integrase [Pseudomonas viridiflava]MCQ9392565.1 integrase [Pseudomonas viridiflava]